MSNQEAVTLTVADIALKYGKSKKGPWTLATITGSDNHKYKTFDEKLIDKAKAALAAGSPVEILFVATDEKFTNEKNEVVSYVNRDIKDLVVKTGHSAPAPQTSHAAPAGISHDDWLLRDRIEFRRNGMIAALNVASKIMSAAIAAGVETYKFDDAMRLAKAEAKALYAAVLQPLEGGKDEDPDIATDAQEEAEVVE